MNSSEVNTLATLESSAAANATIELLSMLLNMFWMSAWVMPMPASQDFSPTEFGLQLIGVLRHQTDELSHPDRSLRRPTRSRSRRRR